MTGGEKMSYSKKPAMILFDVGGTLFRDGKCIFRDGLSALRKAALNPDITDDDTLESLWDEYTSEIGWDFRSRDGAVLDMSLSAGIKYATMRAGLKFDIDIFSQEEIFDRFNSSRELMSEMCTSAVGMATVFSASRIATLVWVYAAGLIMIPSNFP